MSRLSLLQGLLNRYPPEMNVTWVTSLRHASTNYSGALFNLSAQHILSLMERNYTLKVFERLSASKKRQSLSRKTFLSLKMDLFKEYAHPKPFPKDMFLSLSDGSPDQAYVILAQKGTGNLFIENVLL